MLCQRAALAATLGSYLACYIFHTDVNLHVDPRGLPSASGLKVPGDYSPVPPGLTHFF